MVRLKAGQISKLRLHDPAGDPRSHQTREKSLSFTIPLAPSVNRLYHNYNGTVVTSDEVKVYKMLVAIQLRNDKVGFLRGPIIAHVDFYRPRQRGDLDNYLKVTFDALQGIVFDNDEQIISIHTNRYDDADNPRAEIRLEEAPQANAKEI